jgi:hypothetical protein
MDKPQLIQYLYLGMIILVIVCCLGLIWYLSVQSNACVRDPIGFFQGFMNKTGANCLCGEGINVTF